ncbi:MAG: hypothetical protein L0Z50_12170 [Verrucomicrobiales bacterium]|nr:hypothetical protein [Verrucomicrobiales bacterium]
MWHKRTIKLDKNTSIKARPGNNVFVANRGDVSFEYPDSWIVKPSDNSICFYDAEPPADQCVLEFSIMHLDLRVDWSNLPLDQMLCSAIGDETGPRDLATVRKLEKGDLKLVWLEYDFLDPVEKRTALSRCALALSADVLPLITFNFWPEDRAKCERVWDDLLETLRLAKGQRFKQRN